MVDDRLLEIVEIESTSGARADATEDEFRKGGARSAGAVCPTIRRDRVGRKIGSLDEEDVARLNVALAFIVGSLALPMHSQVQGSVRRDVFGIREHGRHGKALPQSLCLRRGSQAKKPSELSAELRRTRITYGTACRLCGEALTHHAGERLSGSRCAAA
jgi:hypothetical protein